MKKIILATVILLGLFAISENSNAQVKVGVNINIGSQPQWGPVGYDYVDYYYMPDIDAYYYVPSRQFIYLSNGRWIFASSLPVAFRSYNLYSGYKVVINEPRPYLHHNVFQERYARYKGRKNSQVIIRNSDEPKYYVVQGHPKYIHDNGNHNGAFKNGKGNNGNGGGNGNGKGHGKH